MANLASACSLTIAADELGAGCAEGFKACDGKCEAFSPRNGCAEATCVPCGTPHATAVCSEQGECIIGSCSLGFGDCDGAANNGCEVNLNEDVEHCGDCKTVCPLRSNVDEALCGAGVCGIKRCATGYGDCDDEKLNGCEIDLRTDAAHCGKCDLACPVETPQCVAEACQ